MRNIPRDQPAIFGAVTGAVPRLQQLRPLHLEAAESLIERNDHERPDNGYPCCLHCGLMYKFWVHVPTCPARSAEEPR